MLSYRQGLESMRWIYELAKRLIVFWVTTLSGAMAFSWVLGYDQQVQAYTSTHRPIIATMPVLSGVVFAIYDWMDKQDR